MKKFSTILSVILTSKNVQIVTETGIKPIEKPIKKLAFSHAHLHFKEDVLIEFKEWIIYKEGLDMHFNFNVNQSLHSQLIIFIINEIPLIKKEFSS